MAAHRDIARRFQTGSTAHDRHHPVATLQCCSQLPLLVDQQRACSPMTTVRHRLTVAAMATTTRSSRRRAPPPLYPAIDPSWRSRSTRRSRLPEALVDHDKGDLGLPGLHDNVTSAARYHRPPLFI